MDELNRKIAEWVGFEYLSHLSAWNLRQTDGLLDLHEEIPDFTDPEWGIAHLFKWVVPKLDYWLISQETGKSVGAVVQYLGQSFTHLDETPALAMCYAVIKLIDSQVPSSISSAKTE